MTKSGHRLTAGAFGLSVAIGISSGLIISPYPAQTDLLVAFLFVVGVMAGASAPDWLEMVSHVGDRRLSLIPHRTLTHWWPVWVGAALYVWTSHALPWFLEVIAFGFIASAMLHIVMDAFSKSGVPFLLPVRRFGVKLPFYTTGGISEWVWSVVVVSFFVFLLVHSKEFVFSFKSLPRISLCC